MGNAAIFLVEILGLLCKGMVSIMLWQMLKNYLHIFQFQSCNFFLLLYNVLRATKKLD